MIFGVISHAIDETRSGYHIRTWGRDGTITTDLTVGTPGQEITVQLDTGSQKCRGLQRRDLWNLEMKNDSRASLKPLKTYYIHVW